MLPATPDTYAQALDELITMGMDMARAIHIDSMNASTPLPEQVTAFERVSRTVRRTILLARRLNELPSLATRRTHARARLIREVEDAIEAEHGDTERADHLRAELTERIDTPDLDEELDLLPLQTIIADIRNDLGLPTPSTVTHRRRTPAEAQSLRRRAAASPPAPPARPGITKPPIFLANWSRHPPGDT